MDPAALQAALAGGGGDDRGAGGAGGNMNYQQFMGLPDGLKRQILNSIASPGTSPDINIIDSNDPMNPGHNLATKLWLTAGQEGRERFLDPG
jgi:hypothetical protein